LATHWTRNKTLYFCVVTQKRVVGFKKIVFKCPLNCPICDQNIEDDWHLLFACTESIQARQTSGLEHVISPRLQQAQTAAEVVFSICQSEDKDTAGLFAVLVYGTFGIIKIIRFGMRLGKQVGPWGSEPDIYGKNGTRLIH
jgi:hypothetical protein